MRNELFSGERKLYGRFIKIVILLYMATCVTVCALQVNITVTHVIVAVVAISFISFNIALIWTKITAHNMEDLKNENRS